MSLSVHLAHRFSEAFRLECSFEALRGINVLFGPSGAGKSTVLDAIVGLVRCSKQEIKLSGETLASDSIHLPPQQRQVGYLMQRPLLFRHLSVAENIAFGLRGPKQRRASIDAIANVVGTSRFMSARPQQLSGGEQQRVALARALATDPKILLLDEPFSALDHAAKMDLLAFISEWVSTRNAIAIYVTHDIAEAWSVGHRVIRLEAGSVREVGDTRRILGPDREGVLKSLGSWE
jgi:ABC-type sulfate/molybdate transport systems ATPase subunit